MGKKITVRKSGNSFIITLPKSYCEMIGIGEGSILDCEPHTKDTLILKPMIGTTQKRMKETLDKNGFSYPDGN